MSAKEVVAAYWAAAEARDWDAFGTLVAEDVLYEVPQIRERVRGRRIPAVQHRGLPRGLAHRGRADHRRGNGTRCP
jgi:ketosteroid isomerase-like protein